jgi:hypothetical protein
MGMALEDEVSAPFTPCQLRAAIGGFLPERALAAAVEVEGDGRPTRPRPASGMAMRADDQGTTPRSQKAVRVRSVREVEPGVLVYVCTRVLDDRF